MHISQLGQAYRHAELRTVNIITLSGLGRYAVQVIPRAGCAFLLTDEQGQPRYWRALDDVRRALHGQGLDNVALQVSVAQDEVIGR